MNVWKGNTTGIYFICPRSVNISYLIITNTNCGPVSFNLQIMRANVKTHISPLNLTLQAGESYTDRDIIIMQDEYFIITSTGSIDYYVAMPLADATNIKNGQTTGSGGLLAAARIDRVKARRP